MNVRIGTRGSKLALWQAHRVRDLLEGEGFSVELKLFKTTGDIRTDKALHNLGERGLFTKALDDALLNDEVDIAAWMLPGSMEQHHSSKGLMRSG